MSKTNKGKDHYLPIIRYVVVFLVSIVSIFVFTVASCAIPHDSIKENTIKSVEETAKEISESRKDQKPFKRFEAYGDIRNYTMIFFADSTDPVRSAIEMNYSKECDSTMHCISVLKKWSGDKNDKIVSYNRYWQGQSAILHFLTVFGSFLTIRAFLTVLFILLVLFTLYKIFKEDKILTIAFIVGLISINIVFVTRSLEYLPVFFVMLITVLLVLRSRNNKDKNLGIIFLVMGVMTCYFDFLTCETIVLTTPLIVYTYLEIKAGKKVSIKKIVSLSALWGVGYAGAFLSKWILSLLFMGPGVISDIQKNIFGHGLDGGLLKKLFAIVNLPFSKLLPFAYIGKYSGIAAICCFIICLIYTVRKNKKYLPLFLICIIPFLRFLVISSHSILLSFFTYRAILCVSIVMTITLVQIIKQIIENRRNKTEKD